MKQIKKFFLGISTIAMLTTPVATALSCSSENNQRIVTISVEKSLKSVFQKIIDDFKKDHQQDLDDNKIKDIKIIEEGAFEVSNTLKNKGFRDETIADIFLLASDRLNEGKSYIKPFTTKDFGDFVTKYLSYISDGQKAVSLTEQAKNTQKIVKSTTSSNMIGIVRDVEALFQVAKKDISATPKMIVRFADLWFSVGYFNDDPTTKDAWNMRDIIKTEDNGAISTSVDSQKNKNKFQAGFKRIIEAARNSGLSDVIALDKDSGKAAPKVITHFEKNKDVSMVTGSWDIENGKVKGTEITPKIIPLPATYFQFGGGWFYTLNKRITQQEQNVAEKLLAKILNPKNSIPMWKAGRLLPFKESKALIDKSSDLDQIYKQLANAIYQAKIAPKPLDPAFNDVYGVYANTITTNAADILDNSAGKKTATALAKKLTNDFITSLKTKVAERNRN